MLPISHYDKERADHAVNFIQCLRHTKGVFYNQPFKLLNWQKTIIRDLFGIIKEDGTRQFKQTIIFIPKKAGKSELAAAVALYLLCADGEQRAEIYGAAADRQMASLVYSVAADMIRLSPALRKRCKILDKEEYDIAKQIDDLTRRKEDNNRGILKADSAVELFKGMKKVDTFDENVVGRLVDKIEAIGKDKIAVTFCGGFRVEQGIISR